MRANIGNLNDKISKEVAESVRRVFDRYSPILQDVHGLPVALWLRMAQDEYGRTGNTDYAHIVRSLCVRAKRLEPDWVTQALNEQSHAICDAALSFQLGERLPKNAPVKRGVRNFRLAHQVHKLASAAQSSRKTAFKTVTKLLPATAHGARASAQTPKRAWRQFASERSFDELYRG